MLDRLVVAADTNTVTLSPVLTGYQLVRLSVHYRLQRAGFTSRSLWLRLNGVSSPVYDWVRMSRLRSTSGGANATDDTKIVVGAQATDLGDSDIAGVFTMTVNVSGGYRSVVWTHQGSTGEAPEVSTGSGFLKQTADLVSLQFVGSDASTLVRAGSTFVVEGL
jgi:hypothetical protein